jgi:hypothetical protein
MCKKPLWNVHPSTRAILGFLHARGRGPSFLLLLGLILSLLELGSCCGSAHLVAAGNVFIPGIRRR